MEKIKVLMVDDSAVVRLILRKLLESSNEIVVIGHAKNGKEALELIPNLNPDVVTLDIEMPVMDGITTLKEIRKLSKPVPVIMVSSLTKDGAEITLEALNEGAVDFVTKPSKTISSELEKIKFDLIEKIKAAATTKHVKIKRIPSVKHIEVEKKELPKITSKISEQTKFKAVLIGISTGGPPALQVILPKFPKNFPIPIVVAQHMPPGFTKPMAERLNKLCPLEVDEAKDGDILKKGKIYIGKAGCHIKIKKRGAIYYLNITEEPKDALYHPQVDIMFETAAETIGSDVIAVIMTGMGSDGTEGLKKLKAKNAFVIGQDKETSVIYGMPRSAFEAGVVDVVVPLEKIPEKIIQKLS